MKCSLPGCEAEARSDNPNSTCSNRHKNLKRQRETAAAKRLEAEAKAGVRTCACGCGKTFTMGGGKGAQNRIYFSRACNDRVNNAKHAHPLPAQVCVICGETFSPKNSVARACNKTSCQTARKAEWRKAHTPAKVAKPVKPQPMTGAGSGVKNVKRSAHVVRREQWKMDLLCAAAMEQDYNPHRPEIYIQRVLARQGG